MVIQNGVEIPKLPAVKASDIWDRTRNRRIVLFVGRLNPIKHLDLQLEAVHLLRRAYPDLLWVLIGPDDGEWARLSRRVDQLHMRDQVLWLGPIYDERRFIAMRDASALLQTSHHEAHSMTVNEGLAVGVPLVVTTNVNFPAIATCGAGMVVEERAECVAGAIEFVLAHDSAAEQMRQAGRKFAATNLSWRAVAEEFLAVVVSQVSGLPNHHGNQPGGEGA